MTERDPIVATALARRPIPDHAPGFWAELEARLAQVDAETEGGDDATVIALTEAPSRRRPRRWLVLATGVAAAAAVAAVAVAVVGDDEKRVVTSDPTTVTTADPAPTTSPTPVTTAPTPTSVVPLPPVEAGAFVGVWPFTNRAQVEEYIASGSTEYSDPSVVVERFASDIVGVVNPVVSDLTPEGTVEVRTRTESGEVNPNSPVTGVSVQQVGAGPWVITGASSDDVTVDSPAPGTAITSPLTVTGTGRAYESTINAFLYAGSEMLAGPAIGSAGNFDLGPLAVVLTFGELPAGESLMLITITTTGADFVGVPAFAVTRVVSPAESAPPPDPRQVVAAFLDAVASGDGDTAWAMVDPVAQVAGGGFEAFVEADPSTRLGPLADVSPEAYTTRPSAQPDVTVVTVPTGTAIADSAAAFAVKANGRIVSTFHPDTDPRNDAVSWVGSTLPAGEALELLIPSGASAATVSVDGGAAVEPSSEGDQSEPQKAVSFPLPDVAAGRHVVTLSFVRPDGLVHAEAQLVTFTGSARSETGTVRQFLQAVSGSDEDTAWALLSPGAQAAMGRPAFDDAMASALPEGMGAFAALPDSAYSVRPWSADGHQPLNVIITVAGEVTREGTTEFGALAFAVVDVGTGPQVEWTLDTRRHLPIPSEAQFTDDASDGTLRFVTNFGADADAGEYPTDLVLSEPGGGLLQPQPSGGEIPSTFFVPDTPGQRVFTLSYLGADGLLHAEAQVYTL